MTHSAFPGSRSLLVSYLFYTSRGSCVHINHSITELIRSAKLSVRETCWFPLQMMISLSPYYKKSKRWWCKVYYACMRWNCWWAGRKTCTTKGFLVVKWGLETQSETLSWHYARSHPITVTMTKLPPPFTSRFFLIRLNWFGALPFILSLLLIIWQENPLAS